MKHLRIAAAADYLGIHPDTLRRWADAGKVPFTQLGRERRFDTKDLDKLLGNDPEPPARKEALYVRVSSSGGQESSLAAQERALRETSSGEVVAVFKDKASGLNEKRTGLQRLLKRAKKGEFTVVRVTHEDRLARFGVSWIEQLLAESEVTVEVLSGAPLQDAKDELLADFMSLVASFAGRMYGLRSRETRERLLQTAKSKVAE